LLLHHVTAFTLVAAVGDRVRAAARRTATVGRAPTSGDRPVLGIAATLLLVVGFSRVFWFEKGAAYYFHSSAF